MMRCAKLLWMMSVAASGLTACANGAGGVENTGTRAQKLAGSVAPLLSNFNKPPRAGTVMDGTIWAAQGFTTGAEAVTLVDLEANVGEAIDLPRDVTAELRQGAPDGALVALLTVPNLAGPASPRHFAPLDPVTLAPAMFVLDPATTYYFVLHVDSGSFAFWYVEDLSGVVPEVGADRFADYAYKYPAQSPNWDGNGSDNPYYLRVNILDATTCTP